MLSNKRAPDIKKHSYCIRKCRFVWVWRVLEAGWSQSGPHFLYNPFTRRLAHRARQTGAGLNCSPIRLGHTNPLRKGLIAWLKILKNFYKSFTKDLEYRLELVWSTSPYTSFTKGLDYKLELVWSTFLNQSSTKRFDYRLKLVWSTFLYKSILKRFDYRLGLVWGTFPYKAFMRKASLSCLGPPSQFSQPIASNLLS